MRLHIETIVNSFLKLKKKG